MSRNMRPRLALVALTVGMLAVSVRGAQTTGTASIAGRVVTPDGSAVRRAIVKLEGLPHARSAVTDDTGAFAFDALPAGQFNMTAMRAGYVTSAYGSRAPGRPGHAVALTPGQRATGLVITIARGAAITGTVTDSSGQPIPNVAILLTRAHQAPAPFAPFATAALGSNPKTDDRGVYRAFGLEPGTYLVSASLSGDRVGRLTQADIDTGLADLEQRTRRFGGAGSSSTPAARIPQPTEYTLAPIYYPGTPDSSSASAISVLAGEEHTGIDIVLAPVRAGTISGAITAGGGSLPTFLIGIWHEHAGVATAGPPAYSVATLRQVSNGETQFTYSGVPPGTYVVAVQSTVPAIARGDSAAAMYASAHVTITDSDVPGLSLSLRPAPHLSGHIVFDTGGATRPDVTTARLALKAPQNDRVWTSRGASGAVPGIQISTDGAFVMPSVLPGPYDVNVTLPDGKGWWLRSVMLGGHDILDTGLDIPEDGGDVRDMTITFSDRHTAVAGKLQTPAGAPATDYSVVVFTTDRSLWRENGRRLVFTRPASDGQFSIADLPPGEYYLAAVADLDPRDWQNVAFLQSVVSESLTITLGEGESKRQDLRLAQ